MKDKTKLQEDLQRKLARQKENLKGTLDEIDMITAIAKTNDNINYAPTITALRQKRDRQASALKATEQYLAALQQLDNTKKRA